MEDLVLRGYVQQRGFESIDGGGRGVCVQLGLHNVAEYLYLVRPDWREVMADQDALKKIPEVVSDRFSSWRYYGVDCDVGSIQKMLERYGNVSCAEWVHAAVGMHEDSLVSLRGYFARCAHFLGFGCSLQRLFEMLRLAQVDVLVMDVEGGEISILENYDWVLKPGFISVEVHGDHSHTSMANSVLLNRHIQVVDDILVRQGYKQVNKEMTNYTTGGYCTCELQYQL